MMSADNQVMYSGLPQDDWKNKPKFPKLLSNGPKIPNTASKTSRKCGLRGCLLIIFMIAVLALMFVIGFDVYVKSEDSDVNIFSYWGIGREPISNNTNYTLPSRNDEILNTSLYHVNVLFNSSFGMNRDNSTEGFGHSPSGENWQIKNTSKLVTNGKKFQTTVIPPIPTTDNNTEIGMAESKELDKSFLPTLPHSTTKPSYTTTISDNQPRNKTVYVTTTSPVEGYGERQELPNVQEMNATHINGNQTSMLVSENSSFPNVKEDANETSTTAKIRHWIENLISEPNLEITMIATGVIFIGFTLLLTGIVCLATRRRKVKIRRDKIKAAVSDLESNEKVVLLADDVSEDEYVKA